MIEKTLNLNLNGEYKPFNHFFRATGYANTDFTYTPPVRRMYDHLSSYNNHPKYMRLHNILTCHGRGDYYKFECNSDYGNPPYNEVWDDVVVKKDENGKLYYNWSVVDKVYDIILSHEMKPIVEMLFIPTVIQNSKDIAIPYDYNVYYEVIRAFVEHWTARYGKEEVKQWYFEITNEPDNNEIFVKHAEYFNALYDYFVFAVTGVDENYQVGGPAVKQWEEGKIIFKNFIHHCAEGVNYVNGKFGSRLDFISVHCKAGRPEFVGPDIDYMFNSLREYVEMLKPYPQFKDTPFFNDESDIVWDGNRGIETKSWLNFRNTEYAPAFMCKMMNYYVNIIEDELGINLAIVDSDNCHLPWEVNLFSGNRSQMTPLTKAPSTDIIKKGFFNAGMLLGKLGNERLIISSKDNEFGKKYGCLATKYDNNKGFAFMLWNFEDGLNNDVNARKVVLNLSNLNGEYKLLTHKIDKEHSNPYNTWCSMGRPYPLNKEQIYNLRDNDSLFTDSIILDVNENNFSLEVVLPMHSVTLLTLVKKDNDEEISFNDVQIEKSVLGNTQKFLTWNYSKRVDFVGYNIFKDGVKLNKNLLTAATFVDSDVKDNEVSEYQLEIIYACEKTLSRKKIM